jgi:WD40 repeat protein
MSEVTRRAIPFDRNLVGHKDVVLWGSWTVVNGQPLLVTGGRDRSLRLWDPLTGMQPFGATHHSADGDAWVWGAWGISGGQVTLAFADSQGDVHLFTPRDGGKWRAPRSVYHFGPSISGGWIRSADRSVLVLVGLTGAAIWDPADRRDVAVQSRHGAGRVLWGAWSEGTQPMIATGGSDGSVRFWHVLPGELRDAGVLSHKAAGGWGAWVALNGRPVLATSSERHTVLLWDPAENGPVTKSLTGHADLVTWGTWGDIGGRPMLATGSADRTVRIWDPATGEQVGPPLEGHLRAVSWGAWATVDGLPVLATGDNAGSVRLWDPLAGRLLGDPLRAGTRSRWGAWQLVQGRPILATGGDDTVVRLWEVVDERSVGATLPPYRSDALTAIDHLDRTAEATAVAELITARSARPPLAIGLFGDWGEGKSHFMALLRRRVAAAAATHGILAHRHVRQVRFNAWHYAETDLWASLVTELFTQLAGPESGDAPISQRQQSRLAAELIAQRGLPQRLSAARARRDDLRATVDRPARRWSSLPAARQDQIRALLGDKAERLYADAARAAAALSWRLRGSIVLLASALIVAAIVWWLPPVDKWWAAIPGLTAVLAAGEAALRVVRGLKRRGDAAWTTAKEFVAEQNQRLTAAADAADAEVAELERQMRDFTAAGQLAGVIAERAASTDYRSRLDVMSRIREDFARMSRLLATIGEDGTDGDPAPDEVGDELPRIDRIVIYVDDLDRCPPARVVEMLEAVHLLLAVDLFVVVVAVDPRWLLAAIGSHYRDLMSPDPAHPAQYLEKIFQVVLTLPPLDTPGYQRMLRGLVGTRTDDPIPTPRAESEEATPAPRPVTPGAATSAPAGANYGVRLPRPRRVDRVDPFALDPDEIRLLDLLGPPHLITTPRQVKRLANSYGLLTALRRPHRAADLAERAGIVRGEDGSEREVVYRPYRAGLVLLAALVAFPALGPELVTGLHRAAADNPMCSWADHVTRIADSWPSLTDVTAAAAAHSLDLPEPLGAWAEWVLPVGRLSFPTGHYLRFLSR